MKLSFIVPIYNVEKYLDRCIDSLVNQDISKEIYEIICIDDASIDNSRYIIEQYKIQYSNIILISHKENKGLSATRNTGINLAKGKYIWFIDSDDFIEYNCLSFLLRKCEFNDIDILCFNYNVVNNCDLISKNPIVFRNQDICNGVNFIKIVFDKSFIYQLGYVWRFIYKIEIGRASCRECVCICV